MNYPTFRYPPKEKKEKWETGRQRKQIFTVESLQSRSILEYQSRRRDKTSEVSEVLEHPRNGSIGDNVGGFKAAPFRIVGSFTTGNSRGSSRISNNPGRIPGNISLDSPSGNYRLIDKMAARMLHYLQLLSNYFRIAFKLLSIIFDYLSVSTRLILPGQQQTN